VELVEVQGHTDEKGTAEYNRQLSQARAASVVDWLVAHGVDSNRLSAKGYGADRPIAENASEEGRQKNRRVEFHILKKGAP
jgi:outer membrane protein OmpA-like peptidoglycan-associated protein